MYFLRTSQLKLGCPSPLDASDFIRLVTESRESLARWSDFPTENLSPERVATYLRRRRSSFDLDQKYFYLVRERMTEALLGVVELRLEDAGRSARLAGWAHPSVEGRGLAAEAVFSVLRVAFSCTGLARVEYRCEPENERSVRLARRLSLVHEATLRGSTQRGGDRQDEMVFSLIAADFPSSPAATVPVRAWDALGRVVVDDLPPMSAGAAGNATWAQIKARLRAFASAEHERELSFSVAMRCPSAGGDSVQHVKLELGDSPMGPWVVVRTVVPAQAALVERHALEHNSTLAYGALCIEGGEYVLRHSSPLSSFPVSEVVRLVSAMAQEAARLGARATRTPNDLSVFEQYRD